MKRKLFWTTFVLFVIFTGSIFIFDRINFYNQISENTESELETIASSVIASNLSIEVLNKLEKTDDILRDVLDDQRIDRTLRIFDTHGELVFNNDLARDLPDTYAAETWSEVTLNSHRLKRLTINTGQYILEVGLFTDSKISHTRAKLNQILLTFVIISILSLIISYVTTEMIMQPLNNLGLFFVNYNLRHQAEKNSEQLEKVDLQALDSLSQSQDEVAVLAKNLLAFLNETTEERNKKSKDLYFLAHELKTPLSHIVIGLEDIKAVDDRESKSNSEQINRLLKICRNLSVFIKDYLRIASIRSAATESLQLSALNLENLIRNSVEQINPQDRQRINLKIESKLTLLAEAYHLESLVSNLISNALKYSTDSITVAVQQNHFSVTDSGAGFNEKSLSQIGQPFNRSGLEESSGLGLTYCYEICKLYSWTIEHKRIDNKTVMEVTFNKDSIFES
ncbi:MAG: sensor histidine kinase [Pseudobdellovibrio sp.]